MNVFIVASVDKKVIKKSTNFNNELINYCPVITQDNNLSEIKEQFLKQNPDKVLLMIMPVDNLQKQIELGKGMLKQMKEKTAS